MSRSFSNCKLVSAYIRQNISIPLKSRGYAVGAATQGEVSGRSKMMFRKGGEEGGNAAATSTSATTTPWVPDPKTGHYRPEIVDDEVDAAQLRQLLLNQKSHRN